MATNFTMEELMNFPLLHFAQANYKGHDNVFNSAMDFYYLVLNYRHTEDDDVRDRIIEHINLFTSPGREPQFDVHAFHSYVPTVAGLALVKHTPNLFAALKKDTKHRVNVLMKAFAVLGIMYTSSNNWYLYNLAMFHAWSKEQAPNLSIPTFFAALGARYYAGSEEAFKELVMGEGEAFDYDGFIAELQECGFNRAIRTFAHQTQESDIDGIEFATIKDLMETRAQEKQFYGITVNKIPEEIGRGRGVHFPYSIKDFISSKDGYAAWYNIDTTEERHEKSTCAFKNGVDIYGECYKDRIPTYLLRYIFNGGKCKNEIPVNKYASWIQHTGAEQILDSNGGTLTAHTMESDKINPSLGKDGMISEFDAGGRSDMTYCYLDFAMASVIVSVCKELGYIDDGEVWTNAISLYKNGAEDLFYKDEVGFVGYNAWDQDYKAVECQNCNFPFYRISCMIHQENLK